MNKQFYLFTFWVLCGNSVFAQTNQGSRLTAMGCNGAAIFDVWGVTANPAAISHVISPTLQLSHQEHFISRMIRNDGLALVIPVNRQRFGLSVQRFGISEYQIIKAGVVATRQFGPKLSLGIRANYHQFAIENYGSTVGISMDFGTIYRLSTDLTFGFYLNNFSQQSYHPKIINATMPSKAYFGITYRTSSKLLLASTVSKGELALGADYQCNNMLSLRAGVSSHPFIHYFGIGLNKSKFLADFTFTKRPSFGFSPQLTIGYVF